jgi:NAD(P)-dependent dehydrogenase (short-subunit alcohol dehydrogenase family)
MPRADHPLSDGVGTLLLTDDERGAASVLAAELTRRGERVAIIRLRELPLSVDQGIYYANLTDESAVAELLEAIGGREGPVAGLVHLLPLRGGMPFDAMGLADWQARLRLEITSLFLLARTAGPTLKQAGRAGRGLVIAATAMGGTFASDELEGRAVQPSQGGVAGLVKTLAREWPEVRHRVVDLEADLLPVDVATHILDEIRADDGELEVGYRGGRRLVPRPRPADLRRDDRTQIEVDASWVILVTGGARGITAEIARDLAARYRPVLLLCGRSALPGEETAETARFVDARELRAALIEPARQRGEPVSPASVEALCTRLLRDLEMRTNQAAMRQAGATVQYVQMDVHDAEALAPFVERVYRQYGRLDGVIHGAGIIEDRLIEQKSLDSFNRVFQTKVDSAFTLSRVLRPDSLRFLAFFSSVAARFGNRGQADYAAANEVLNKLAVYLDRAWPGRVVSFNWGPWDRAGMVSAEARRQFAERGLQLISPRDGCEAFDRELRLGHKGEVEVILGDGPWETANQVMLPARLDGLPLLAGVATAADVTGSLGATVLLDPSADRYLQDHRLDGRPVFPLAMAMELMAEAARAASPRLEVVGIRDLRVLQGIVVDDGAQEIQVRVRPRSDALAPDVSQEVDVEIARAASPARPSYRGVVQLAERLPASPPVEEQPRDFRPFELTVDEAYRRWLFHGPAFQGISSVDGIDEVGIAAQLQPSQPEHCLRPGARGRWLLDPVLIDASFQLAILWERAQLDMTPLPAGLASYRRFGAPGDGPVACSLRATASADGQTLLTDSTFRDASGRLFARVEGMEFACSRSLNRLAQTALAGRGTQP